MLFKGTVNAVSNKFVMVDTGAECNCISLELAKELQLSMKSAQHTLVSLGESPDVQVHGVARVQVRLATYACMVEVLVVKTQPGIDLILGEPWLQHVQPLLSFGIPASTKPSHGPCMYVRQAGKHSKVVSWSALSQCRPLPTGKQPSFLLSHVQLSKCIRRKMPMYLALVTTDTTETAALHHPDPAVAALLQQYKDVFPAKHLPGLPPERHTAHTIPLLPGTTPMCRPMFRYSHLELEEMQRQVKELLALGLIEPSHSPYGAPVLFVKKKNGTFRMAIDYRALNAATVKSKYPLPRIDDILDKLHGAQFFSSIDLMSGYHQVLLKDEERTKTAFRTPFGQYQFKVLPFGLCNAPATFQSVMNEVFAPFIDDFVCIYLDDILVFSKSKEEHLHHLRIVLDTMRQHKLYGGFAKCNFLAEELPYLGHIITREGVKVDPHKIQAITTWTAPTDASQVRRFLGLTVYFRRFVKGYSLITQPLTKLLCKRTPFVWSHACQAAFDTLKHALTSAPILCIPDCSKPFEMVCDAAADGIGGVLLQDGHPVAFESKKFSDAETRYSATERELLAVVHCCNCLLYTSPSPRD